MSDQVTVQTYDEYIREFMQRYSDKKYAEALAFLDAGKHHYPDSRALIEYNRACMYSVQGMNAEALDVLREAQARGYWFRAQMLQQDTDFTGLRGNPDFESLVQQFQQRYDTRAKDVKSIRIVTEPPATAAKPYPLLLTLHGNNSDATSTSARYTAAAKAGWLVANLQSSQLGMTDTTYQWDNHEQSIADVTRHHAELLQSYPVNEQSVVISGFSMGGQIASVLGVSSPFPLKGIIGVGTYLGDQQEDWAPQIAAVAERGLRVYLLVGDQDDGCYPGTLRLADMLRAANVPCELKVYPGMGHVYPPDFNEMLITALNFITA